MEVLLEAGVPPDKIKQIGTDLEFWRAQGFVVSIIETSFEFESIADAERLLGLYFGERARPTLRVGYRVALMVKPVD